jgi:signal transduction histidine kinase
MRQLALLVGAALHIESRPGAGTTVRLRLPRGRRLSVAPGLACFRQHP